MFRVQSLKRTIILQFAVILIPLTALLAFQSTRNASRSAELGHLYQRHELANGALGAYRVFLNGAVDAVDTGQLTSKALDALKRSADETKRLGEEAASPEMAQAAARAAAMAAELARDPGLSTLQKLQPEINAQREFMTHADREIESQMDESIGHSIAEASRDTLVVGILSLLLLGVTIAFIAQMVRGLSRPLNLAVSLARRIADGHELTDEAFASESDIGRLLQSLAEMYRRLRRSREEIEASQRRLEDNLNELRENRSSLAEAQHLAQLGSWHWDATQQVAQFSDETLRILAAGPQSLAPTLDSFIDRLDPQEQPLLRRRLQDLLREPGSFADEFHIRGFDERTRIIHHQVSSRTDASGQVQRLCGVFQDITVRRQAEAEIRRLAHYDGLTGLPNRQLFQNSLTHAVARARRDGELLATLFIDLDRFKRINDTLGHAAGDALLKEAARRLTTCVRDSDYLARESEALAHPDGAEGAASGLSSVARLAGDEFTAALVALRRPQDAALVAQRFLAEMGRPFTIDGTEVVVTASVGIALFPMDGGDAETLIKNADTAMYRAKESGKNAYQFFADDMNKTAVAKLTLEGELRRALERGQFLLHYQPKVDATSGAIVGVEALIRWSHPELGLMAPGQFIPLAEEAGLITSIGDWVLEAACAQIREWRDAGLPPISMAINLASPSFRQRDLVERVQAALQHHRVEPSSLQLEATESMLMSNVEQTMGTLNALRGLGVKLSIDDFGTGYSSLSYLRRLPINQLKIDRSFVADMSDNADDAAIVSAIISLGRSLGLEVVAEGVETPQQARLLRDLGCSVLQGYYFSRPLPADRLASLLRNPHGALHAAPPVQLAPAVV